MGAHAADSFEIVQREDVQGIDIRANEEKLPILHDQA